MYVGNVYFDINRYYHVETCLICRKILVGTLLSMETAVPFSSNFSIRKSWKSLSSTGV